MFLRALWARMRRRFGRLGWQYSPKRDGQRQEIRIGWATLGAVSPDGVEIGVHYKRRGVIDAVYFIPRGNIYDRHPNLNADLEECVAEALSLFRRPTDFQHATRVKSIPSIPVALYRGHRWYIGPLDDGSTEIGLTIRAFDEADSRYEFEVRLRLLLNMLAAWTNCAFQRAEDGDPDILDLPAGVYWEDMEWLDDYPIAEGLLRLEPAHLAFGDIVAAGIINDDHKLARAAHHFHEGIALHLSGSAQFSDLSTVLFVSALEVISLPEDSGPPSCASCGQPIYRISQRVVELGTRHLGPGSEWVFKDHYARRSKYLHTGGLYGTQPLTSQAIPLLDPSAPNGCAIPRAGGQSHNLMEFTSFVIRAEVRMYVADHPLTGDVCSSCDNA